MALAKEFRRFRPKVVIGFGDKTPMASPDHWQAMQITDAAVFYSRLSKWDEHFDGLPVHLIAAQLYFRLAFEPMTLDSFASHFTVDISETLDRKLAAIRCYETQFPPEKEYVFDRVQGAALLAGYAAGEVFVSTRPLGTPDLMKDEAAVSGTVGDRWAPESLSLSLPQRKEGKEERRSIDGAWMLLSQKTGWGRCGGPQNAIY